MVLREPSDTEKKTQRERINLKSARGHEASLDGICEISDFIKNLFSFYVNKLCWISVSSNQKKFVSIRVSNCIWKKEKRLSRQSAI